MSLSFSLDHKFVPFEITSADPDNKDVGFYLVRSLTGSERDTYLTNMRKKIDDTGAKARVREINGMQSLLLTFAVKRIKSITKEGVTLPDSLEELEKLIESESLSFRDFEVGNVTDKEVQGWLSDIQGPVNDVAMELSGLNKTARTEAKND